jgi:hypothetical protein
LVRPDLAHLRPGITVDHAGNIKATAGSEKRFRPGWPTIQLQRALSLTHLRQKNSAEDSGHYTITALANESECPSGCLANSGAQEASVILYAYLATGQKVRNGCHHLCAATRAGTNCQDQITERRPSAWSDDLAKLAISFHMLAISTLSRSNAMSRCEYFFHRKR